MRHRKNKTKLNRTTAHKKALMRNLAKELIKHETISTTKAKAKELKKVFTHKNQYSIEEIEELDSGHSKTITHYTITIMHIEFPEEEDIEKEIKEQHDLEYDQVLFNL